jgi:peptide/nickel transport system permease protein
MVKVIRQAPSLFLLTFVMGSVWVWTFSSDLLFRLDRSLVFPNDVFGRNMFQLVLQSAAPSLLLALITTALAVFIGSMLGWISAVGPRPARLLILGATDLLLAFPSLLFSIAWTALRGPSWTTLATALVMGLLPAVVRASYGIIQETDRMDFVWAARGLGATSTQILMRHYLPEVWRIVRLKFPMWVSGALLAEATLGFLGVGAPRTSETWGSLLSLGRDHLFEAPHIALLSGVPLVMTLWSLQRLGLEWKNHESTSASP